ncbi:unnamed protein product, partial [Polarella glacialis]
ASLRWRLPAAPPPTSGAALEEWSAIHFLGGLRSSEPLLEDKATPRTSIGAMPTPLRRRLVPQSAWAEPNNNSNNNNNNTSSNNYNNSSSSNNTNHNNNNSSNNYNSNNNSGNNSNYNNDNNNHNDNNNNYNYNNSNNSNNNNYNNYNNHHHQLLPTPSNHNNNHHPSNKAWAEPCCEPRGDCWFHQQALPIQLSVSSGRPASARRVPGVAGSCGSASGSSAARPRSASVGRRRRWEESLRGGASAGHFFDCSVTPPLPGRWPRR